jgi:hypothetical protein
MIHAGTILVLRMSSLTPESHRTDKSYFRAREQDIYGATYAMTPTGSHRARGRTKALLVSLAPAQS